MARSGAERTRLLDGPDGDLASLSSARAGLAERLRARRSEIEEAVLARFSDIGFGPAGGDAEGEDAEYLAGSRLAIAESVDYGLRAIERGEEWFGSIPPAAVAQARRAARNGLSLEKVLLRTNAGHTVLEDFVVQEVDFSSQGSVLRRVFPTLGALLDHFTALMAHEYQRELERVARSPELRSMERVQRLLAGQSLDAAELGYRLDRWHLGVIALGTGAGEAVRAMCARLGCELLSVARDEETVWAWLGGQRTLERVEIDRALPATRNAGVSMALGAPGRGLDGWRLTHRQAQAAMLVAQRRPQRLTRYADVSLLAAVLKDPELAASLVEIHLSSLDGHRDSAVSRETLRAYFVAGCNAATAAAALGVDRHTVERRLHAIEKRLGRLLHTCHAELEVALAVEELGVDVGFAGESKSPAL